MRFKTVVQLFPLGIFAAFLAGFANPAHPRFGLPPTEGLHGILLHLVNGLWVMGCFAADYPKVVLAIIGLWVLTIGVRVIAAMLPVQKDPQRMYTSGQRQIGFARSDGRCELEGWLWRRCQKPAGHGDHYFPWSKGGATDMANFVSACVTCNLSKGARIPTTFERVRLERRRRKYFTPGVPIRAGNKVAVPR